MSDFLTRRGGTWQFIRRVPAEFAGFDPRRVVQHSTKIKIADDRTGRRAARVALKLNDELELFWLNLAGGQTVDLLNRYEEARHRARALGFDYADSEQILALAPERRLERLETLVRQGAVNDPGSRAALLGTEKRPVFKLSKLFEEYETVTKDEIADMSSDQLRIWRNGRVRAVKQFVKLVGNKLVTEISDSDGIDYMEWWRARVIEGEASAKTANKAIGQLSRMLKDLSVRRRLNLPEIFKGLRLRGESDKSRVPFDPDFIQSRFLGGGLAGLNEDARLVLYVMIETGMRPSEICNLQESTIALGATIPHIRVAPDGRRLKTEDSAREIPLVGVALEALKLRPHGFPRYRDKASGFSAAVNKYLTENGLRPTRDHTVYSLRHSFKDRLVALEAPDSLIDSLMGHRTYKPKYGKGPSLELKLKFLGRSAFICPVSL